MPIISIIVPVYNAEKYVRRCINSLLSQTLDDIEYIIVNDCSTDSSLEIIEEELSKFPQRREFVRIINHKTNLGVAKARETGIMKSTGEYLIHCDSDDYVKHYAYEKLYKKAKHENADIVFLNYIKVYEDKVPQRVERNPNLLNRPQLIMQLMNDQVFAVLWGALVKRSLYTKNFIWPNGNLCEDRVHLVQLCLLAKRISILEEPLYYYYMGNQFSLTKHASKDKSIKMFIDSTNNDKIINNVILKAGDCRQLGLMAEAMDIKRLMYLFKYFNDKTVLTICNSVLPNLSILRVFNPNISVFIKIRFLYYKLMLLIKGAGQR